MYIEVVKSARFFWCRIKSRNHQIVFTSEGYSRVRDARRAARNFVTFARSLSASPTGTIEIKDRTQK